MRPTLVSFGFFVVLIPPLALVLGSQLGAPWLAFVLFVAASPITRAVFGTHPVERLELSERTAATLHALPGLYLAVLFGSILFAASQVSSLPILGGGALTGFGLSLWTVLVFGAFPAHEMLHRRNRAWIRAGSFTAGLCGYPVLGLEDAVHHDRPGSVSSAEWPGRTESVWAFTARRIVSAVRNGMQRNASLKATQEWGQATPLCCGVAGLLCASGAFWALGGWAALLVYVSAAVGVCFSMQVMTYVQHWGLGDDSIDDATGRELAWEDDCQMQAWLTLGNSFHQAHHRARDNAYFFLCPAPDSPRQPGCYVMMLGACLVPGVWRALMLPVLKQWKDDGNLVCQPGRWALCINPSRRTPAR